MNERIVLEKQLSKLDIEYEVTGEESVYNEIVKITDKLQKFWKGADNETAN